MMTRLGRIGLLLLALLLLPGLPVVQAQASSPPILINQVGTDPAAPDQLGFIELFDGGVGGVDLTGLALVIFDHNAGTILSAYGLDGARTDEAGSLLLGTATITPSVAITLDAPLSISATGGIALVTGGAADFPVGDPIDLALAQDALVVGIDANEALGSQSLVTPPPAGADPLVLAAAAPAADSACGAAVTPIHLIQGATAISSHRGQTATVEAAVVGDFQDTRRELRGFFISEGLFVLDNGFGVDVAVGDRVRLSGTVDEFLGQTRLKNISELEICGQGEPTTPMTITLPLPDGADLERYEGMLVAIEEPLTVAQTYFLGRYGQITLAAGGPVYQPTQLAPPDTPEAQALAAENGRRLLVLDDGQDIRALGDNPDPVPYLDAPPPAVIRGGDVVSGLVGIIDQGRINSAPGQEVGIGYRLHPTAPPHFVTANERTPAPPEVGGDLRVAGFNVLNYFNGDGQGGGFPTARGAASPVEFERQRTKIIAALTALDADVIGLMELENDGYGPGSAIADLVEGLNASVPLTYTWIDPGLPQLGDDAITVGLIYRPATVQPVGPAATLDTGPFDQTVADGGRSRQPLAQTFADANGERFTVVVNHFKSKNPGEGENISPGNRDSGNGAGAWNERRAEAAQALIDWLATDPTGSGDPDILIIGDLNAYAQETPITTIEAGGYVNLLARFQGNEAYSYVFDGQLGYLDHALASATLAEQVTGAADWHINADEPKVIDYETRFNPPGYYSPDPYRSSDHDPALIGLTLAPTGTEPLTPTIPVTPTEELTPTTPLTPTTTLTPTTPLSPTLPVTPTAPLTPTTTVTSTPPLTETETLTPTLPPTVTESVTPTPAITTTAGLTPTLPWTPTDFLTPPTTITGTPPLSPTVPVTPTAPVTPSVTLTTPTPITPTVAPGVDPGERTYTVQPGDSLSTVARQFGITLSELATANGLSTTSYLYIGQRLVLPSNAQPTVCRTEHVVQLGDTLTAIARQYGLTLNQLATANGLTDLNLIRLGQSLCIPQ
jgi:predicted extracellular nuclease